MKALRFLGITLLMVLCTVNFSSCSKDDDSSDNSLDINLLYGTWKKEDKAGYNESNKEEVLVFNSNMTWSRTNYLYGKPKTEEGTYSYDIENKELTMIGPDGRYGEVGEIKTRIFLILVLTKERLTYIEYNTYTDDSAVAYSRQ